MKKKLSRDDEALLALATENGLRGVKESQAQILLPLSRAELISLAQYLEEEGRIRILGFSPLFFISRESVDFLGRKIVAYIAKFHRNHPGENRASLDQLKNRFDTPVKILLLALKTLVHDGTLRRDGGGYALKGFERRLPPREEKILRALEEMSLTSERPALSSKDLQEKLGLSAMKLESLLDILVERKKIVRSPDGFFLHSPWLDDLAARIRSSARRELTVADFKAMTGLSRKYAIPLLELLDEMGVTRRRGATREIL
jgi:selenocysteine-specific elongation factor